LVLFTPFSSAGRRTAEVGGDGFGIVGALYRKRMTAHEVARREEQCNSTAKNSVTQQNENFR